MQNSNFTGLRFRVIGLLLFIIGIGAGFLLYTHLKPVPKTSVHSVRQGSYKYINPLLECEVSNEDSGFEEITPFKNRLLKIVEKLLLSKDAIHISVYFRDLNNGPWFGINENEPFAPASLLKVPIMITFLKNAESKPEILEKKLLFEGNEQGIEENIAPSLRLVPGRQYTVDQLIYRMVVHSDNDAMTLLNNQIDVWEFRQLLEDLMIDVQTVRAMTTVKSYASYFRILYNASYLNKVMSEKALDYLSHVDFKDGLFSGLPNGIQLSAKFGVRKDESGNLQLHDCGIIYYPQHPYLLCVMTRGNGGGPNTLGRLSGIIREISASIYSSVDKQLRTKRSSER
jgi:beta-lactamase class A